MTNPNTTNSELKDLLQYICSDYLQSTHQKDPDGMRLVIETGIEDIEAYIASKVEEAQLNSYMRGYNDNARDCYCDSRGATEGVIPHKHLADDGQSHDIRPDIQRTQRPPRG